MGAESPILPTTTPFIAEKSAEQEVQIAVEPNKGLTKERYGYYSNGVLFDESLLSEVEAGIRLETTATGTDETRVRTAYAGQYISHSLAQPGLGFVVDDANVNIDANGYVSLSHGELYAGAFYWDTANDVPLTGLGFHIDTSGLDFFVRSLGAHIGQSPIPQQEFDQDRFNGDGDTGQVIDPSNGIIGNFPYAWYNQAPLGGAFLNNDTNKVTGAVETVVQGRPSIDTPNLPPQIVVRNAGTASTLGVELGGMQYVTYGSSSTDLSTRPTPESRVTENGYVSDQRALTRNAVDPSAEPGKPLVAYRRLDGEEEIEVIANGFEAKPMADDIYIIVWDEWQPETALTGANFSPVVSANNSGEETKLETDTEATAYTPTEAYLRNIHPIDQGDITGSGVDQQGGGGLGAVTVDARLPLEAARIYTAVNSTGTAADLNPFVADVLEGF